MTVMAIHLEPAWIALIGTVVGTIGLKIVEHLLGSHAAKRDDRMEFRSEIKELNERLDKVEAELDEWKGKYYAAQEQILTLKAMVIGAGMDPEQKL